MTEQSNHPEESSAGTFFSELKRRKVVRVALVYLGMGWLVIQVASSTFSDFGIPLWAYRFVVLMVALGFPLAVILAWAFELTPDGIATTKAAREARGGDVVSPQYNRRRNWMAYGIGAAIPTVIFGIVAIVFYFTLGKSEHSANDLERSIAVLPFENRSQLPEDANFTDGIHDDLLTLISRIKDIKTISRTSVMQFRQNPPPTPEIGELLDVSYVLEGGVQRSGNQIRINVQLIDAARDAHVWAQIYDRELTAENLFKIQSEIAQSIADALEVALSQEEKGSIEQLPTDNLTALEMYYEGSARTELGTTSGLLDAIPFLQVAIQLDPDFAEAYALLARIYIMQIWRMRIPEEVQSAKATPLIAKALELKPELGIVHTSHGMLLNSQSKRGKAEKALRKGLQLSPNDAFVHLALAMFLSSKPVGQFEESIRLINRAIELEPDSPRPVIVKGRILLRMEKFDEAESALEDALKMNAVNPTIYDALGDMSHVLGKYDQAILNLWKAYQLDPGNPNYPDGLWKAYKELDLPDQTLRWIEVAQQINPEDHWAPARELFHLLISGNLDEASAYWWEHYKDEFLWVGYFDLMMAELEKGIKDRALERFRVLNPDFFVDGTVVVPNTYDMWRHKDVAVSLIAAGNDEAAMQLLRSVSSHFEENGYSGNTQYSLHAMVYNLMGDSKRAIACLKKLKLHTGWAAVPGRHPNLKNLVGIPEFDKLNDPLAERWQAQRERVLQWEREGVIGPIPELPKPEEE